MQFNQMYDKSANISWSSSICKDLNIRGLGVCPIKESTLWSNCRLVYYETCVELSH